MNLVSIVTAPVRFGLAVTEAGLGIAELAVGTARAAVVSTGVVTTGATTFASSTAAPLQMIQQLSTLTATDRPLWLVAKTRPR